MNKYFIFLLIIVFASSGLISKSATYKNRPVPTAPTATPVDNSESLMYLDKGELELPARPGYSCREKRDRDMIINVIARGINVDEKKNVYKYTVSGGRVLDEGKNIRWVLNGSKPGTYKITVAVSDGEKTKESTQFITVRECVYASYNCFCPTISVTGNRNGKDGETIDFTANISGAGGDITYNWTVSQGEIVDGQGTPTITVKITDKMIGAVEATAEIGGICDSCLKTAAATVRITK